MLALITDKPLMNGASAAYPSFTAAAYMLFALLAFPASAAAKDGALTGFHCKAANGATRALNIDLRKRRFDEGSGFQKIPEANATTIVLRQSGPDTLGDNGGLGPLYETLSLDRRTLVLTHWRAAPQSKLSRTDVFQCVMGPRIDLSAGVRF